MKRIKEIIDNFNSEYKLLYGEGYHEYNINMALYVLKAKGERFKVYEIHLLQSGMDVIIGGKDYHKFGTRMLIPQDGKSVLADDFERLDIIPCNNPGDIRILPILDLITLNGVFCDGKWYDEFIVSKYGIEHIRELK